jgi:hypothetical protein
MSMAGGAGAAHDATVEVTPEIQAYLDATQDLAHARYERERQVEGTAAHGAHVAMLTRLWCDAHRAVQSAVTAYQRAEAAQDGALHAHREANEHLRAITEELEAAGVSTDGLE